MSRSLFASKAPESLKSLYIPLFRDRASATGETGMISRFGILQKRDDISTEAFKFEGATPPPAEYRRVVTNEGITLLFSAGHEENKNVEIKTEGNGGVEITIRSTGLERNDELEKMPRIPD